MVVEIPAGTNHKYKYDSDQKKITLEHKPQGEQMINFLPFPGNYGFIPATSTGAEGKEALQVLLLSEALPSGIVVEIIPIAALLLAEDGKPVTKIIAVPKDSSLRILTATDFSEFLIEYDAAKRIIEEWFLHYQRKRNVISFGWRDQSYCLNLIENARLKPAN